MIYAIGLRLFHKSGARSRLSTTIVTNLERGPSSRKIGSPAGCLATLLLIGLLTGCGPTETEAELPDKTQTVEGLITEVEFGTMSLRVSDGRQLIFSVRNSQYSEQQLTSFMNSATRMRVTYTVESGRLIPSEITPVSPAPTETVSLGS